MEDTTNSNVNITIVENNNTISIPVNQFFPITYFNDCLKYIENLNSQMKNSEKEFKLINNNNSSIIDNTENMHIIIGNIIELYLNIISNFEKLNGKIIAKLKKYVCDYKEYQNKYLFLYEVCQNLNKQNKKVIDYKNTYLNSFETLEKSAIDYFEDHPTPSNEIELLLNKVQSNYNIYKNELADFDKNKKEYQQNFKNLTNLQFENTFFFDIIKDEFILFLQDNMKMEARILSDVSVKKLYNQKKNIVNYMKYLELYDSEEIQITKNNTIADTDLYQCIEDKKFTAIEKTINYIKNNIGIDNIYPDYDMEKEKLRLQQNKFIASFFDVFEKKAEINEENKNKLINLIKDPENHKIFFYIMNKFRSQNEKTKEWIELIGDCLSIIITRYIKENNYQMIRNCIILTQTFFYYEGENKTKMYLFQKIENNALFKEKIFWKNFINIMVINQFKVYLETNNRVNEMDSLLGAFITGESAEETVKVKFADLLYTQLLYYSNIMIDFNIDKNDIKEVIEYFNSRYKNLLTKDYETILLSLDNRS